MPQTFIQQPFGLPDSDTGLSRNNSNSPSARDILLEKNVTNEQRYPRKDGYNYSHNISKTNTSINTNTNTTNLREKFSKIGKDTSRYNRTALHILDSLKKNKLLLQGQLQDKSSRRSSLEGVNNFEVYTYQNPIDENKQNGEESASPKLMLSRSTSKVNDLNDSILVQFDDRSKLNSRRSSIFEPANVDMGINNDLASKEIGIDNVTKSISRLANSNDYVVSGSHNEEISQIAGNPRVKKYLSKRGALKGDSIDNKADQKLYMYGNGENRIESHTETGHFEQHAFGNCNDVVKGNPDINGYENIDDDDGQYPNEPEDCSNELNNDDTDTTDTNQRKNNEESKDDEEEDEDQGNNSNSNDKANNSNKPTQALVQKLQDIYKNIVRQEVELQEKCAQLTSSQTTDLNSIWSIYRINVELVTNYVTFISTALLSSQSQYDLMIGQEIVETYRIGRRLWVYGTITFLDVLKNFSSFMDPEVCSQFITHVFISISTMLADIPTKYSIPWMQRLGDLSRMAIALYPSGFIDWKLSSEYWYNQALKYTYGYGKLYYHMSTIQQNTLEAFVNLGKSVFCQDTFIPSPQYMQLVIDNIYQRAFIERGSNNTRNSQLIEYLKHSEVMLLPNFIGNENLQKVVMTYFEHKFGTDLHDLNIFQPRDIFLQNPENLKYFFRHAPAFAESHILQTVGFGDSKNPFALLFDLPKFLKEKKDKKDRKKTKSSGEPTSNESVMSLDNISTDSLISSDQYFSNLESMQHPYLPPPRYDIWLKSLSYLNLTAVQCGVTVLRKFLHGPFVVALPHLMVWTYFIISVCLKSETLVDEESRYFWSSFMRRLLPLNSIVSFLNVLIAYALDNSYYSTLISSISEELDSMDLQELLTKFNNNEELPEVWKCWGTLWFDAITDKSNTDTNSYEKIGVSDHLFFDSPIDGIVFDSKDENGEKFWKRALRIIFLFKKIAETFDIGITLSHTAPVYCRRDDVELNHILGSFSFKIEQHLLNGNTVQVEIENCLGAIIEMTEMPNEVNITMDATPPMSLQENENIFEYTGYKRIAPELQNFDKNGELRSAANYTSWYSAQEIVPKSAASPENSVAGSSPGRSFQSQDVEENIFSVFTNEEENSTSLLDGLNLETTSFVLDATSWLRHSAHIYKLASNSFLVFSICLTTFQELRFLRKSKDENVMEAAARAIIIIRQLYSDGKVIPLRFTGNIATHIEEHLEFEEQITWRSHVDEFVIESISKAQKKFLQPFVQNPVDNDSRFFVLVSDDENMKRKAHEKEIRTFTTRFVFALCSEMGKGRLICTN